MGGRGRLLHDSQNGRCVTLMLLSRHRTSFTVQSCRPQQAVRHRVSEEVSPMPVLLYLQGVAPMDEEMDLFSDALRQGVQLESYLPSRQRDYHLAYKNKSGLIKEAPLFVKQRICALPSYLK